MECQSCSTRKISLAMQFSPLFIHDKHIWQIKMKRNEYLLRLWLYVRLFSLHFVFKYQKRKYHAFWLVIISPISHKYINRCWIVVLMTDVPTGQQAARSPAFVSLGVEHLDTPSFPVITSSWSQGDFFCLCILKQRISGQSSPVETVA